MPEFVILEAQEEIRTCMWRYRVEAGSAADALRQAQEGEVEAVQVWQGEGDYGDKSGWALVESGNADRAWNIAVDRMTGGHESEAVSAQAAPLDTA